MTPSVWVAAPEVGTPFGTWLFDAEGLNRVISSLSAGMQLSYYFYREKTNIGCPIELTDSKQIYTSGE